MTDREAYVAFNLTDRIGSAGVDALVSNRQCSVVEAWEQYPKKLARNGGEVDWRVEFEKAEKFGVSILTQADADYPEQLRQSPGRPLVLYVKGDVKALSRPGISIVGTRRATTYGRDQAYRFGHDLAASGWSVISGLALGIDAEAHRGALDAGGITVGVIGSGLDRFFPEENRELAREMVAKRGAVVSEFPFGRPPDRQTFPQRNHVVAALAKGVLAIEAPAKSGTLITTGIAAELGRTVMALPGRVDSRTSSGCLTLIREGARMVRCPEDVEEELGDLFAGCRDGVAAHAETSETGLVTELRAEAASEVPYLSIEESLILRELDLEGMSLDELAMRTKLPTLKVNSTVMMLRMKGRVRFLPGNRVALPRGA